MSSGAGNDFDKVMPSGRPVGTFKRVDAPGEGFPFYYYEVGYNGETFRSGLASEVWNWATERGIILCKVID